MSFNRKSVSEDIQSSNLVAPIVSSEHPFNEMVLTKVEAKIKEDDEGKKKAMLVFHTATLDDERHHNHYEFPVTGGMGNMTEDKVIENQDRKLAHWYNMFMGDGAHIKALAGQYAIGKVLVKGEGDTVTAREPQSWEEFFNSCAKAFNEGRGGKPVFEDEGGKKVVFWLKLTYDKKGRLQLPLFGNFVDKWREGEPPLLDINPEYDRMDKPQNVQVQSKVVQPGVATNVQNVTKKPKGFKF